MSILNSVKKEDFYFDITTKNRVLKGYKSLAFNDDNTSLFSKEDSFYPEQTVSVKLFPLFLSPTFCLKAHSFVTRVSQDKINGYAIVLNKNLDFETFFKKEYSKSFRANITRLVTRLETCFNVSYKMFYGSISKNDYQILMQTLHSMLTTRFNQRNDDNKILKNWKYYELTTYDLINTKKASLFVIYNDTTPIHICINHHYDPILFVSIPSYDIDYTKFALGNISIYKLLEWSINNNYKILDMAYGDLEYKRRWSTIIYPFEHHIFYNNNLIQRILAKIEIGIIRFKNYLKSKNIDDKLRNLKSKYFKTKSDFKEVTYTLEPNALLENDYKQIDFQIESLELSHLRKPIFEFLYKHKEHIDNIEIYEILPQTSFIISNKNSTEKITIT
jgi:hypothetical protein